ncbi:MAG: S1 RNA-binding domain-containing protein, partial [Bacteroidota bacterium]
MNKSQTDTDVHYLCITDPFSYLRPMIQAGQYHELKVLRIKDAGAYLNDGKDGILLPKKEMPRGTKQGDELTVFVYHDSEDRPIATTLHPKAIVGDIVKLKVVGNSRVGAFLDWGLMKDLLVPKSKQISPMRLGGEYLVHVYLDEKTGRVAASQYLEHLLSNDPLSVKEKDPVQLTVYRKTDLGYVMIINKQHTGLLHFNDVFRELEIGEQIEGYIKTIRPDHKIDLAVGKPGYQRVEDETGKIIRLLHEKNGFLPYHDKTDPETIYDVFGMSKKAFKMAIGKLYIEKNIYLLDNG